MNHRTPSPLRKLRLDVDALRVDSFRTAEILQQAGTVEGFATELYNSNCCGATSDPPPPSYISCVYSCGVTTTSGGGDTRVMSCNAADCTHEH